MSERVAYEWFDLLEAEANFTLGWRPFESPDGERSVIDGLTLFCCPSESKDVVPMSNRGFACGLRDLIQYWDDRRAKELSESVFEPSLSERGFGT